MGLTNTEIVEAREKELRDCLLSPETEHIDSCFDSEDEEDACERAHGGDTWRKRFASATCGITSNSFWKKIRRLRSVPKQVWEERALLMDERRRQNKTPGSRHPTEGSQRDYQGKRPGTLRDEGPQSQLAVPKRHLRGRNANAQTPADTENRACPEPGEFRGPLREMTHPDGSVGASSKPLLFWRPRVAKSRYASSNDIHHQVTVAASSSMIDATHPQVVRLSSPPRIDVLLGAIVVCGLLLVGFSVFLLRRHRHYQLNQAARRVYVRSNATAYTWRSSRLSIGTVCPKCAQRAVVILQAFARGRLARAHACRRAKAAVRLQRKYRGWALAFAYRRLKCAAVVMLVVGCVALVRLACRRELAATVVQAHWRGWRKRAGYRRRQHAVVLLHAAGRDALAHLSTTGRASAITLLQSHWRGWRQQTSYRRRQHSSVWLRDVGRDALVSANTSRCATAITLLQVRWRGLRQRACHRRRQHAAVWLNAVGRDVLVHANSSRRASAMTLLQAHYRGWRQRESCRRRQHAALWLHAAGRDALMGVSTSRRTTAITLIQARWRGWRSRAGYRRRQYAAVSLYTAVRDALMRLNSRRSAMSAEGALGHERHAAASAGCRTRVQTHQRDVAASVGCRKHAEIIIRRILERRRGLLTLAIARNHVAIKTREARRGGLAFSCQKGKSGSNSTVVVPSTTTASGPPIKKQHNQQAKPSVADPCNKDKPGLAPVVAGPRIATTSGSAQTKQPTQQPAGKRPRRRNRKPRKATPHSAIAKAVMSPASEALGPGTAQGRTSDIHESKVPTPPRNCPMCTFANAGGDEGCRMCGSALPKHSTSDGDNTTRPEDAGAASSRTQQQLPPGGSAATARASLEETEDSVYLEMLAEAQRESAALAGDLEKHEAEWKQQSKKSRYLSKQKTAVYRGHGNTVAETNPVVPAGTGRFAAFEDDDEDDDDDDHGDDNSHEPGVQEEEEGKLSDEDFEEDLRQAMAASLELHTALAAGTNTPVLSGGSASGRSPTPPGRDNVKPARCKDGSARVGASCGKVEATSQGNGSRIAKPRGHIFKPGRRTDGSDGNKGR